MTHNLRDLIKTLTLCLPCYHVAMENSRETKKNGSVGGLPEFHELFCHDYQKEKHIQGHQNGHFGGDANFVSGIVDDESNGMSHFITIDMSKDKKSILN